MTPLEVIAAVVEGATCLQLCLLAAFLVSSRKRPTSAPYLLAGLCAAIGVMMGTNLLIRVTHWRLLAELVLGLDLITPALVLLLVRQMRRPAPPLRRWDLLHGAPALLGLAVWNSGLVASMDPYVIGCWVLYLGGAIVEFSRRRGGEIPGRHRRGLIGLLGVFVAIAMLRMIVAAGGPAFLTSGPYLLLTTVGLAATCLMIFSALGEPRPSGLLGAGAKYVADPATPADLDALSLRLEAALQDAPYLDSGMTLATLSSSIGAPPRLVSRLINERYGLNVAAFINRRRVDAAERLLIEHPTRPIKAVMYDAGFSSKSIFNREFQRHTGLTPGAFRRRGLPSPP